jgi:hypothetical protein
LLYQAIYVLPGQPPVPHEIIRLPELRIYVENWGKPNDIGFIASLDDRPVGAVWLRLLTGNPHGYGFVDDSTPELTIALLPVFIPAFYLWRISSPVNR